MKIQRIGVVIQLSDPHGDFFIPYKRIMVINLRGDKINIKIEGEDGYIEGFKSNAHANTAFEQLITNYSDWESNR